MQDSYQEVAIAVIAGAILFMIFSGLMIYFLFLNQRKKFRHARDILSMREIFKTEMLTSQLEIQEQTFNHISQEIHDNVGQILSLAKVQISIMNESDDLNKGMLDEVKQNISKALTDLRDIAKSLSSDRIRNISIMDAAFIEADRINKSGVLYVSVSTGGDERKIDDQKKQILFRIIQESLQNIIKHAQASEVTIKFNYFLSFLELSVEDNGKGFDVNKVINSGTGLGLQNINTRTSLIGATVKIESELNRGTAVRINIPYE